MDIGLHKTIFGLDISDHTLRIVKLAARGKKIFLESYGDISLPEGTIVQGEIQHESQLILFINDLLKSVKGKKIHQKNVIAVLPETKTFIKVITLKQTDDKEKIRSEVEAEIKNHIPLPLEEIYIDWQIVASQGSELDVLVGAAPKETVEAYAAVIEKSGLTPYALEIESAAILRSLQPPKDETLDAKIIVDLGAVRSGLIVYDHGTVQFTASLPLSGSEVTQTIAAKLGITFEEAEKIKIQNGLDDTKQKTEVLEILKPKIDEFIGYMERAILFYRHNYKHPHEISEIVLCGGGANFLNLNKIITEKINLPVTIGNPLQKIQQKSKLQIPPDKQMSFTTAVGLALRAIESQEII